MRVGDVLRLKSKEELKDYTNSDGLISYNGLTILNGMMKYLGKPAKVSNVEAHRNSIVVKIDIDKNAFWWPIEVFTKP